MSLALPDHAVGDTSDEILRSVLFEKDAVGNLIPVRMQVVIVYLSAFRSFTEYLVFSFLFATSYHQIIGLTLVIFRSHR